MVSVRVLGETPEEEFEEVAERAYRNVPKHKIESAQSETELSQLLIDEYFEERLSTKGQRDILLPGINRVFKKRGWWEPPRVITPKYPELELPPVVTEKPMVVEKKVQGRIKRPKVSRVKLSSESSESEFEKYVESRPVRAKRGKIRFVTKSKKSLSKETYLKRLKNLSKGWKLSKTRKGLNKKNK